MDRGDLLLSHGIPTGFAALADLNIARGKDGNQRRRCLFLCKDPFNDRLEIGVWDVVRRHGDLAPDAEVGIPGESELLSVVRVDSRQGG